MNNKLHHTGVGGWMGLWKFDYAWQGRWVGPKWPFWAWRNYAMVPYYQLTNEMLHTFSSNILKLLAELGRYLNKW